MIIFEIITTFLLLFYVLKLPKIDENMSYVSSFNYNFGIDYIMNFIEDLLMSLGFYGASILMTYGYVINKISENNIAGGFGFLFLIYVIGLFCLKDLLCVIFLRQGATGFSD